MGNLTFSRSFPKCPEIGKPHSRSSRAPFRVRERAGKTGRDHSNCEATLTNCNRVAP